MIYDTFFFALHQVIDIEPQQSSSQKANEDDLIELNNTFTQDHIPDLNKWLESSSKINVPLKDEFTEIKLNCDEESNEDRSDRTTQTSNKIVRTNNPSTKPEPIKYLNLTSEQLNGKQLQILTSLSYLVNEERLSVLICKIKLPFFRNLYQQFPLYRRTNSSSNQNHLKIYQQLELIKQTKYVFVKIYLIDSGTRKRISKKKTSLLSVDGQNTILNNNPYDQNKYVIINEMMIFKLPIDQLSKITIRLSVLGLSSLNSIKHQLTNQGDLRTKKFKKSIDTLYSFGYVEIGCNSLSKSAFLHYQNLLNNLRKPVCMWHSLDINKQTKRKSSIS